MPFDTPFLPLVPDADTEAKSDFDAFTSSADERSPALLCLFRKKSLFLCSDTVFELSMLDGQLSFLRQRPSEPLFKA